jgi:DNA polymerase delta subunit 2
MTLTMRSKRKERAYSEHKPKWQRFQTSLMVQSGESAATQGQQQAVVHPYQRQYAHVYHQRLTALKPRCWMSVDAADLDNNSANDNESVVKVERVLDLSEGIRSVVVGTLVKEGSGDKLHPYSLCQSSQSLFVEDESGRANLAVDNVHEFTTGMVLGLMGTVQRNGNFQVERAFYPALKPHYTLKEDSTEPQDAPLALGDPHLLLVSGLHCGDPGVAPTQKQMLLDYIRGSCQQEDETASQKIAHVIIAGGSTVNHDEHPTIALKELDGFCLQIGLLNVPVDILPGKNDPTTANWPQRPLHRSLLKYSDRHVPHLVTRVPNPYGAFHTDKYVLGTDGTNAIDLAQSLLKKAKEKIVPAAHGEENEKSSATTELVVEPLSHMEALRLTLQCGHICPTGPDTVPTMPHPESDPMVLEETPHVYFAGNCNHFETDLYEDDGSNTKCRLVCIPKFSESGVVVLVNLATLNVKEIRVIEPRV